MCASQWFHRWVEGLQCALQLFLDVRAVLDEMNKQNEEHLDSIQENIDRGQVMHKFTGVQCGNKRTAHATKMGVYQRISE
eukprot:6470466-Amphidinium_carterae.1